MNTLYILQNALISRAKGKLTEAKAIKIASSRLGGAWAVAQDTKRLGETDNLIRDLSGKFYETTHMLLPVRVSTGRALGAYISKKNFEKGKHPEIYKCDLSFDLVHAPSIAPVNALTEDGRTLVVAGAYCERVGYIFRWNDGTYRTYREPAMRTVSSYHGERRPQWWASKQGIGMELEINCNDRDKLARKIHSDILIERDGSLDTTLGVELIGGPYTCQEYENGKTPWQDVLNEVKNLGGAGHNASGGSNFYGIHLSVSRSSFTTFHGAKFVVFFNQQKSLCQLVAQRTQLYGYRDTDGYEQRKTVKEVAYFGGNSYDKNSMYDHTRNISKKIKGKSNQYYIETGKYEPVKVDDKRYEVRIFRSNLRWERILKNIQFVDAVREYTKTASALSVATPYVGTVDFLVWLGKQAGYTHLKKYLVDNASIYGDVKNADDFKKQVNFKLNKSLETAIDL